MSGLLRAPRDVEVSPDGRRVAFALGSQVWLGEVGGAPPCAVADGPGRAALPRFSPDGTRLAFLADRERPGMAGVHVLDVEAALGGAGAGGGGAARGAADSAAAAGRGGGAALGGAGAAAPRAVGDLAASVEQLRWSRDGTRLLVLAADPGSDRAGAHGATRIAGGGEGEGPLVLRPRAAWRRLWLLDASDGAGAAAHEAGPDGLTVWEVGWAGAGAAVAIVSEDPSESGWYGARVALLDLDARTARLVHEPAWQLQSPVISPDGRRVAFVEGIASDRTEVAGSARVLDLASGAVGDPAPDHDLTALRWLDDGDLLGAGPRGLETTCVRIDAAPGGAVRELWRGPATIGAADAMAVGASADGRVIAAVVDGPGMPPEVALLEGAAPAAAPPAAAPPAATPPAAAPPAPAAAPPAAAPPAPAAAPPAAPAWRPLTSLNATLAEQPAPPARRFAWRGRDGLAIEGILLLPPGAAPPAGAEPHAHGRTQPLPLVVLVHGGPANAWTFSSGTAPLALGVPLASAGYAVLMPNPRGSTGRGQRFARANVGDLGGADLQDVLAGVDTLVAAGIADRARVGIAGKSYGGFMAAWAAVRSGAFAAAVPIACVSDWLSFHTTTNIGRFDELYLAGDPYDPAGPYAARSPVVHARGCTTPTLILHGAEDLCTPVGQAHELYGALADAGCETELVVYPRAGHGWTEPEQLLDTHARVRGWFDRHLRHA
ncbi:S9 family peptidase [Conexibacter woesei]|uniref:Peptidase S9 prolyl oligopeptidase active site domain protein n=1 Tax=Conexibacter woesei (strain DSM 14684 / CCUG 47730 / CIP 108061 / JCM 11494 / NBRC 100937 / ID131577) TaxID=469383 RepID=D3FF51_CONWI|nr:S9 family peptidase [Conexibacter woesei]ADB51768.1 peptidase S9 prolyl oligopeptidase active site domain protein [Conexibacter woesei DSM 14684]